MESSTLCGASAPLFRGPQPCISPDIHRRGRLQARVGVGPPPGGKTDIPSRTEGPGERRAQGERTSTGHRGPALREPSGFCHAVAPAVAVIRDVYLVAHFRLVRPLVEFSVRDKDTFGAVTFPLLKGIRHVNVFTADLLAFILSCGEGRGSDAL